MLTRETIYLFCRVVDNFGDIGVCWRQAFKSNVLVIVGFLVELGYCLFEYSLKESLFRYLAAIVVGMFDTWRRGPESVFCRQMGEKKTLRKIGSVFSHRLKLVAYHSFVFVGTRIYFDLVI